MGVKINELVPYKEVDCKDLRDKVVVVDASLFLYQFLTTIRGPDGTPLMDAKGGTTSHLVGLFSRSTKLMQYGIKLAYVFDGVPPVLKQKEQERRSKLKFEALEKYNEAVKEEDIDQMKKYAGRTSRLTKEMVNEAKDLCVALGLPVIQAPSEAEAQAAHIVREGLAYALATQDTDSLMFGASKLIRNLSLVGKKKTLNKLSYESVRPEIVDLSTTLNVLGIDQDQFIVLCILVGTDYNYGGVKGIGPKNALKLVKEYRKDFDSLFGAINWGFDHSWREVFDTIKNIPVTDNFNLSWRSIDEDAIKKILVEQHNFSEERVESSIVKLKESKVSKCQKGLGDFL